MLPMNVQDVKDIPFSVTIKGAEVLLDDQTNQIGLEVSFEAEAPPLPPERPSGGPPLPPGGLPSAPPHQPAATPIDGTIAVVGELVFEAQSGAFYFKKPRILKIESEALPADAKPPISRAVEKLLEKHFEDNAVYTLNDDDLAGKTAGAILKSINVRGNSLHITLGF